jgi:hypothetical protein
MSDQSKWAIAFLSGLIVFLTSLGTYMVGHVDGHPTWELYGHISLIAGSGLGSMVAALKYQLPRPNGEYADRVTDQKLNEINKGDDAA